MEKSRKITQNIITQFKKFSPWDTHQNQFENTPNLQAPLVVTRKDMASSVLNNKVTATTSELWTIV